MSILRVNNTARYDYDWFATFPNFRLTIVHPRMKLLIPGLLLYHRAFLWKLFIIYIYKYKPNIYIYINLKSIELILKTATMFWNAFGIIFSNIPYFLSVFYFCLYFWREVYFKKSLRGLNSEFSFSKIGCLCKIKDPSLFYYLHTDVERIVR